MSGTILKLLQMSLSEYFLRNVTDFSYKDVAALVSSMILLSSPYCSHSHSRTPRPPRHSMQESGPRCQWPAGCPGPTGKNFANGICITDLGIKMYHVSWPAGCLGPTDKNLLMVFVSQILG